MDAFFTAIENHRGAAFAVALFVVIVVALICSTFEAKDKPK